MHDNLSNGVAAITVAAARNFFSLSFFRFLPKTTANRDQHNDGGWLSTTDRHNDNLVVQCSENQKKAAGSSSDQQRRDLGGVMSLVRFR